MIEIDAEDVADTEKRGMHDLSVEDIPKSETVRFEMFSALS